MCQRLLGHPPSTGHATTAHLCPFAMQVTAAPPRARDQSGAQGMTIFVWTLRTSLHLHHHSHHLPLPPFQHHRGRIASLMATQPRG